MFTNSIIRQMNQQSRELRALKSRQTIPGDSIEIHSMRNEFHQTITLGNVQNAYGAILYSQVYAHAVDIATGARTSDIGLTSFNLQVKQSGHGWDDPIPVTTPSGKGVMEQRISNISVDSSGNAKISLYVLNDGEIVGEGGSQYGVLTTRGFQTSIISVGTTGFVIDRIVGHITYSIAYQSQLSQQTVNFDYN